MTQSVIKVGGLGKVFKIPHERYSSLKQNAVHLFSQKRYSVFEALKNISFEINKGEFFGIVGRNGSGKSTLLKLIAGIYVPTTGKILIDGHLSPFIELGVGFVPDLSARDNIFLNGAILGLSRKKIEEQFDKIIAFAELEDFVDQQLKNYSSGMQVRLAFSIATQTQSNILLLDEVLAVGDINFQTKCFNYFRKIKSEGRTVVFVSHSMDKVEEFCDRALLLHKGEIKNIGDPKIITKEYKELNKLENENV